MCGECVRSILCWPRVVRCLEAIDECMWHTCVFMSVVVTVWGYVGNVCCVATIVNNSVFSLGVLKYVWVRDVWFVVYSVCIVTRGAVGVCVWEV